jgi:hypothetical protein
MTITIISVDPPPVLNVVVPAQHQVILTGVAGPQGIQGIQGPTGPTGAAGSTDSNHRNISQTAHGFVVGNVLRIQNSATTYIKAQADVAANAEVVGVVSAVVDANTFTIVTFGYITGLSGLTKGTVYFLSDVTPGLLTPTEPTPNGAKVSKPLLIADSATSGYFTNERGFIKSA